VKKQLAVLMSLVGFGLMPKAAAQETGADGAQWNNPMSGGI
jgi:hypothetical protein